jgi:hypothetical protein
LCVWYHTLFLPIVYGIENRKGKEKRTNECDRTNERHFF